MKWKYLLIAALVVALVVETDASKKKKKNRDDEDTHNNEDTEFQGKISIGCVLGQNRRTNNKSILYFDIDLSFEKVLSRFSQNVL